jgi:cytochrome c553
MRSMYSAALAATFLAGTAMADVDDEDLAFARHLADGCASCHLIGEPSQGIPPIHGMDQATFVRIFTQYREGERVHRLLNTVASRYSDEEIQLLGAYLAGIENRQ